jgi:hypothetical protein
MNRYIFIRRLRGPAFLMLVGVNALLAQAHILGWGRSWPLYLVLAGVLLLAERAALAADGYPPYPGQYQDPYPGQYPGQYPGAPYNAAGDPLSQATAGQQPPQPGSAIVPAQPHEIVEHDPYNNRDRDRNGGQ